MPGCRQLAELGIHLDDGAHIHHQHKGRAASCAGGARAYLSPWCRRACSRPSRGVWCGCPPGLFASSTKGCAGSSQCAPALVLPSPCRERHRGARTYSFARAKSPSAGRSTSSAQLDGKLCAVDGGLAVTWPASGRMNSIKRRRGRRQDVSAGVRKCEAGRRGRRRPWGLGVVVWAQPSGGGLGRAMEMGSHGRKMIAGPARHATNAQPCGAPRQTHQSGAQWAQHQAEAHSGLGGGRSDAGRFLDVAKAENS